MWPCFCLISLMFVTPYVTSVVQRNMVREATAFLLEALAGDRPDQAALQTKLLEINLITNPQVRRGSVGKCGVTRLVTKL